MSNITINAEGGNQRYFDVEVSGGASIVITLSNSPPQMNAFDITIIFRSTTPDLITMSWPSNIWWPTIYDGGPVPDVLTAWSPSISGDRLKVELTTTNDGTTWYASWSSYMLNPG